MSWPVIALCEVVDFKRIIVAADNISDGSNFVGLEHIDGSGEFVNVGQVAEGELGSSKFRFTSRQILFGKLRPYLRKIARPDFDGICSTDILPLTPRSALDRDYLFHALRQQEFIDLATARASGANLPRIAPGVLAEMQIPLPPLPEQRRIAAILDKADALRAKRRQAIAKLDQLLQSVFLDMFGDPVTNPRGWPLVELGSLVSDGPQNGLYKPASDYGSGTPILRIDGFRAGDVIDDLPAKRVRLDITDVAKYQLRHADLVINRVNSPEHLGKPALIGELSEPVVFESNMMRLTLDQGRVSPKYLLKALLQQNVRDQISRRRKDAVNQSSINQTDVSTLTITLPPVGVQEKFAAAVLACEKQRQFFASWTRASDALFASMQGGAFSGPP